MNADDKNLKKLNDDELMQVAGGSMQVGSEYTRVADGTCPNCGKTRYKTTVSQLTENGPWENTYYECDQCGILDKIMSE